MSEKRVTEEEQELCQLLVQLDLLTRDQVNDAFLYQCRLPNCEVVSIEQILVEMELISASMLQRVKDTYHKAAMIFGRHTGPLALPPSTSAPKLKAEQRPSLKPMQKPERKLENAVCQTAELTLSPELKAMIKSGGVPLAVPQSRELLPVEPMSFDEIPFAELSGEADLQTTMVLGTPSPLKQVRQDIASRAKTLELPSLPPRTADKEAQDKALAKAIAAKTTGLDMSKTLIIPPPAITPTALGLSEVDAMPPLASLGQKSPICLPSVQPQPKTQPAGLSLMLPDLSAKLSKSALPPQIGEILLKNHDVEEWQLMHALCIQKETPSTTPRLGTLLIKLGYVNRQSIERALSIQLSEELNTETRKAS